MNTRQVVTAVAVIFIGFFAFLTVSAAIESGFTVLTFVSILILGLFLIGILGALSQRPRD